VRLRLNHVGWRLRVPERNGTSSLMPADGTTSLPLISPQQSCSRQLALTISRFDEVVQRGFKPILPFITVV
jgi:hypothetical protein